MSKKIFILSFLIFTNLFTHANQESFLQANALHQEKKYKKALKSYDLIEKKGPATWYNMGNSAFKTGDYPRAILYWRRAQKNSSYKTIKNSEHNISIAYKKLGYEKDKSTLGFLNKHVSVIPLFVLQILFLFFWIAFFVSLFYLKKLRKFVLLIVLVINFLLATLSITKYRSIIYQRGVVMQKDTNLFVGPDKNYHKITSLGVADEFKVLKKYKKWYKIKYNKFTGWVLADKVEII